MHELVARFDALVGDLQPDLVLTHTERDLHWDHGLVHRATISALRRVPADLLAFTSSYELNAQVRSLGNCFVDVTETIDTKLAAINAHRSQLSKMDVQSSRDLARGLGRICGVPYAESYEVLRMRL
jgi:LmbE family N-acetylglucosaminyl deacetylase